jgi:predicted dehydrogenase
MDKIRIGVIGLGIGRHHIRGYQAHLFVDSIVTGTPHTATGEEGLLVMEILDAIYQSAESGHPVRIAS